MPLAASSSKEVHEGWEQGAEGEEVVVVMV